MYSYFGYLMYSQVEVMSCPQRAIMLELCQDTHKLYNKLCEDFGVYNRKPLQVVFIENYTEFVSGVVFIFPEVKTVCFNATILRYLPDKQFGETMPHEIAHAFAHDLYGALPPEEYHGKNWAEIMEFLQVPVKSKFSLEDREAEIMAEQYRIIDKFNRENPARVLPQL